ncbi:MAG: ribulose-phosphate 3-epimerase [Oscillospiraceae bacterium]|nr:ribulose-phosphate 3-epimerase [Oscillospiraceae bacterium]
MTILSPSILAANVLNLGEDIQKTKENGVKWIHIDVMDGTFVPNLSFGYSVVSEIRKATDMTLDVHLMIDKPIRYVEQFAKAGADYLTIHVEADTAENTAAALKKIKEMGVKAGISVKPATQLSAIEPFLKDVDLVLVMTVEPGFGGQKFMENMMPKLKAIKEKLNEVNQSCRLEVDGGVDLVTGKICKENGADTLVAGSAFYKAEDKKAFLKAMEA